MAQPSVDTPLTRVMECVSVIGTALPPSLIFIGKAVPEDWIPEKDSQFKNWHVVANEKGHSSSEPLIDRKGIQALHKA